jgi:hypothetical protein
MIKSRALIAASLSAYRENWLPYVKILAVVALPFNLVNLLNFISVDLQTFAVYGSFADVFMNVALLWSILEHEKGRKPTMPEAYYSGMNQVVSYLLTSILLVLMLIPFAIGFTIFTAAAAPDQGTTPIEVALVGLVALIVTLPSLFLIVRFGFALVLSVTENLRPTAALRLARRLTLGRFWRVAGRLVIMSLFLILLTVPAAIVAAVLSSLKLDTWAVTIFQVFAALTILPIAYLYALAFLKDLQAHPHEMKVKKTKKTTAKAEPELSGA